MNFDDVLQRIHECKPPEIEVDEISYNEIMHGVRHNHELCDMIDGNLVICGVPILVKK